MMKSNRSSHDFMTAMAFNRGFVFSQMGFALWNLHEVRSSALFENSCSHLCLPSTLPNLELQMAFDQADVSGLILQIQLRKPPPNMPERMPEKAIQNAECQTKHKILARQDARQNVRYNAIKARNHIRMFAKQNARKNVRQNARRRQIEC